MKPVLHWAPQTPLLQVAVPLTGCGQSAAVQQLLVGMQLPAQSFWSVGHWQLPPGPEQVWPGAQSAVVQQLPVARQLLVAAQTRWPFGQAQAPPGPEHVWPLTPQSVFAQQVVFGMQALPHGLNPALQVTVQAPPVQAAVPLAGWGQSADVQQLPLGMQPLPQAFCPLGHWHVPPGPEQVWPETVQSWLVQQPVLGMQRLLAAQTRWPVEQAHVPPACEQTWPPTAQSALVQQAAFGMQVLAHFLKPALQVKLQVAFVQDAVPFAGATQRLPQAPQLFTSPCRFTQPAELRPQQLGVPTGQQLWPQRAGLPAGAAGPHW